VAARTVEYPRIGNPSSFTLKQPRGSLARYNTRLYPPFHLIRTNGRGMITILMDVVVRRTGWHAGHPLQKHIV